MSRPRATKSAAQEPEPLPEHSRAFPWQTERWNELCKLAREERLGHALLLEGRPGTGRNAFGIALARHLLCLSPQSEGNCGSCKACQLSARGVHADFHRVAPAEDGKAIGIDAIRAAIGFVARTPTLGSRKVLLCSPAELLTIAASNAFLKCLEEPQGATVMILVSAAGHPLPATVRSRCQRYTMASPNAGAALQWLTMELGQGALKDSRPGDSDALREVLELTDQRPLLALQLIAESDGKLLALARALQQGPGKARGGLESLERAAAAVEPETMLSLFERATQQWLKAQSAASLRGRHGRAGFAALEELAKLQAACRAGTNPSPELLRFTALRAYSALWRD